MFFSFYDKMVDLYILLKLCSYFLNFWYLFMTFQNFGWHICSIFLSFRLNWV